MIGYICNWLWQQHSLDSTYHCNRSEQCNPKLSHHWGAIGLLKSDLFYCLLITDWQLTVWRGSTYAQNVAHKYVPWSCIVFHLITLIRHGVCGKIFCAAYSAILTCDGRSMKWNIEKLRFCLRLMQFRYSIQHVPEKLLCTDDTLSRALLREESNA